jgi:hypothetical protein
VVLIVRQLAQVPLKAAVRRAFEVASERALYGKRSEVGSGRTTHLGRALGGWERLLVRHIIGLLQGHHRVIVDSRKTWLHRGVKTVHSKLKPIE